MTANDRPPYDPSSTKPGTSGDTLSHGPFALIIPADGHIKAARFFFNNKEIPLSPFEKKFMAEFIGARGRVVTVGELRSKLGYEKTDINRFLIYCQKNIHTVKAKIAAAFPEGPEPVFYSVLPMTNTFQLRTAFPGEMRGFAISDQLSPYLTLKPSRSVHNKLTEVFTMATEMKHGPFAIQRTEGSTWSAGMVYAGGKHIPLSPYRTEIMAHLILKAGDQVTLYDLRDLMKIKTENLPPEDLERLRTTFRVHVHAIRKALMEYTGDENLANSVETCNNARASRRPVSPLMESAYRLKI